MNKQTKEWSRAVPCKPKDNLTTEGLNRAAKFVPSCETDCTPVSMACLLGWEYARIWLRDRDKFVKQYNSSVKGKIIKNDFESWLKQRRTKRQK